MHTHSHTYASMYASEPNSLRELEVTGEYDGSPSTSHPAPVAAPRKVRIAAQLHCYWRLITFNNVAFHNFITVKFKSPESRQIVAEIERCVEDN